MNTAILTQTCNTTFKLNEVKCTESAPPPQQKKLKKGKKVKLIPIFTDTAKQL